MILSGISCSKDDPDSSGYVAAAAVANDVATDSIMPWVERFSQAHLNDTPVDNTDFPPGELFPSDHLTRDAAVGLFSSALLSMGYEPDTAVLSDGKTVTYNVFAEWPGTTKPGEVILVAGHIDAFYGGADDNTSAIAALLETARAVKKHSFARTIRFIAFDLEEFGSLGSTRYVQAGLADDVKTAIVLDLVGYASDEPDSQKDVMGIRLPDVGNYLMVLGNKDSEGISQQITGMSHSCGLAKTVGVLAPGDGTYFLSTVFMRSDHGLMWYKGIPSVFFTDGANFRNPNYHLPSDLPQTINQDFLINNTRLLTATIALLAEVQK
jgi:hypothetical protein